MEHGGQVDAGTKMFGIGGDGDQGLGGGLEQDAIDRGLVLIERFLCLSSGSCVPEKYSLWSTAHSSSDSVVDTWTNIRCSGLRRSSPVKPDSSM